MMANFILPTEFSEDDVLKCSTCASTLLDPVLLKCLHSVCRSCTSAANSNVTCTVCQVTTDTSTGKCNYLVSSLELRAQILKSVFSCKHCIDDAKEDAAAVAWCYACQQPLCPDLQKYHKILLPVHNVMPLNERTLLSELYRPPLRYCTKHGEELKLACFTCQDCRCCKCAHDLCYVSSHDVQLLDSADAVKRINDRVADLARLHSNLNSTAIPLYSYLKLPETVASARQESLRMLQNAKKTVMESIDRAYAKAERSLLTCWDTLISKSLCGREAVERLQARLSWTNTYCRLALSSNDIPGIFPQLDEMFSSLSALLVEARRIKEPVDPLKMVTLNVGLPCDLDLITCEWLGLAEVVNQDFNNSLCDLPTRRSNDYCTGKVSTPKELEQYHQDQKEERSHHQYVQQSQEKLQMKLKDQQLVTMQNKVKKFLGERKALQQQLQVKRKTMKLLKSELKSRTEYLVTTQNEVKKLLDERTKQQHQLEGERMTMELLKSKLKSKTEYIVTVEAFTVSTFGSNLTFLLPSFFAPTAPKPLSFGIKPHGTFKGPGRCRDVAVTPAGSLLVAAMADGLKEYDATSLREIATWKPDADLLGQSKSVSVRTVDVLSDGRALVGLHPNLVVLLKRDVARSSSSAAEAWRVERRVAELQGAPRRLSAWDDRLLAVLEDLYDESTKLWRIGPVLVLLSLSGGYKQLHRQQLAYNANSVALTDRGVIVTSEDQVELTDAVGSGGGSKKCFVVECYSLLGVRLWRHVLDGGHKVMSVCSDLVGRVLYAAKCRGPVVALSVDDGRELSTAISLSTTVTETSYAIRLERATQHRLALISRAASDDKPNIISIFSVL